MKIWFREEEGRGCREVDNREERCREGRSDAHGAGRREDQGAHDTAMGPWAMAHAACGPFDHMIKQNLN
jgi:hypothetical protein